MKTNWDLTVFYKDFDDPAFKADLGGLDASIAALTEAVAAPCEDEAAKLTALVGQVEALGMTFERLMLMVELTLSVDAQNKPANAAMAPLMRSAMLMEQANNALGRYLSKLENLSELVHSNETLSARAFALLEMAENAKHQLPEALEEPVMKMQLSGKTFDGNVRSGVYFNRAASASRPHDYIGLYRNKTVAAIGKICARITAEQDADGQFLYTVEQGELTEKRERTIRQIMEEEKQRGNDLFSIKHRYFFVEKFYETDFPKRTLRAPMGPRIFDLTQVLNTDHLPDTAEIARRLREKSWE